VFRGEYAKSRVYFLLDRRSIVQLREADRFSVAPERKSRMPSYDDLGSVANASAFIFTGSITRAGASNATPLGMSDDDPLPISADQLDASMFVGDVVAGHGQTPLLRAAQSRRLRDRRRLQDGGFRHRPDDWFSPQGVTKLIGDRNRSTLRFDEGRYRQVGLAEVTITPG
jgi:hypothetical protein